MLFLIVCAAAITGCKTAATNNNTTANAVSNGNTNSSASYDVIPGGGATPTEAYKNLFAAVKGKNPAQIKGQFSKKTLEFAEGAAQLQKKPLDELCANGFIQANLSPTLPAIRDERIKGEMGAVEVQDQDGTWQDVAFVKEDGSWKLAIGDQFKGSYQSPGLPASAANANTQKPQMMPAPNMNSAANANVNPKKQ